MVDELKKLMVHYRILNEGELFCTNLNFNMEDENLSKMIGDPGNKDEDAVKSLNNKIKELQDEHIHKLNSYLKLSKTNGKDFAKAIYFASYYNRGNFHFQNYFQRWFSKLWTGDNGK